MMEFIFSSAFSKDERRKDIKRGEALLIIFSTSSMLLGFASARATSSFFPRTQDAGTLNRLATISRAEKNAFDCIRFSVGVDKGAKALFCHVGCGVARIKMLIVLIEVDRFHFLLRRV